MPKTKGEKLFFSIIMSVVMVYGMELYNLAVQAGGLQNELFGRVFADLPLLCLFVLVLEAFVAGPFAKKMTLRLLSSEKQPIFITLCIAALTVSLMCPMMSAVATVWFKHPGAQFPAVWLQTVALNFPMAFFWQIIFAGPAVRALFRLCFGRKIKRFYRAAFVYHAGADPAAPLVWMQWL